MSEKENTMENDKTQAGYELSDLSWKVLLGIGCFIIFGVGFMVIALDEYFMKFKVESYHEIVLAPVSPELLESQKRDIELSTSYSKLSEGRYRIPVDRAMQLIVDEHSSNASGRSR